VLVFCIQLALQSSYSADAAAFLNAQVALVIGFMVGLVVTRLIRTIGVQTSVRRLIRAGLQDLAGIASGRLQISRAAWASRMLDRVGLLLPRLGGTGETPQLQYMATLKDLRVGVSMIELQALRDSVEASSRVLLEALLRHASEHFGARARGLEPQPSLSLLDVIDGLIRTLLTDPRISSRHGAVVAAVGLRCSLFPNAQPYAHAYPTSAAAPGAHQRDSS
jgi:uncharacterized membrane protein YccC